MYIDPLGTFEWGANLRDDDSLTDAERQKRARQRKTFLDNLLNKAKKHLDYIKKKYKEGSDEYKKAKAAIDVYGKENEANGVIVDASYNLPSGVGGQNLGIKKGDKTVTVEFDANKLDKSNIDLVVDIAHEGSHAKDGLAYLRSGISRTDFDTEYDGYFVESLIAEATTKDASSGFHSAYFTDSNNNRTSIELYNVNWGRGKSSSNQRNKAIEDVLALPKTKGGLYELKRGDKTTTYYR